MNAEARSERLIAALQNDRKVCALLTERLVGALATAPWRHDDPIIYLVAVTLDHYYSSVEAIIERITRTFEGLPDRSDRWHKELLEGASLELRGVRAAIVSDVTSASLLKLLEFRHFMRHAYAVALDPDLLLALSQGLLAARPLLEADLDAFIGALRGGSNG